VSKLVKDQILNQRYRLIKCLGEGGMATVWLARDIQLDIHVALKFLNKDTELHTDYHQALKREWEIASNLIHPNIVRVYEFYEDSIRPFYSMQFIDGVTISILCKDDLSNSLRPFGLIADALDYAHSREIMHGDIKANNILLDKKGQPFIVDFGVASTFSEAVSTIDQDESFKEKYFSDDIRSLGKVIYEIIHGLPPTLNIHSNISFSDDLEQELKKLLEGMLKPNINEELTAIDVKNHLAEIGYLSGNAKVDKFNDDEVIKVNPASVKEFKSDAESLSEKKQEMNGVSLRVLYMGLGFALIIFFIVVFVLPKAVKSNKNIEDIVNYKVISTENTKNENENLVLEARLIADEVLGELVSELDMLQDKGIEKWGGIPYQNIKNDYQKGDSYYLEGNYENAQKQYTIALVELNKLSKQTNTILQFNLDAGKKAFENNNFNDAIKFLDITVSISPKNTLYADYYRRALNLEQVLNLMNQGIELEKNMDLNSAKEIYKTALRLDSDYSPVISLLASLEKKILRNDFEIRMSEGFIALTNNDFQSAKALFSTAKEIDPESGEPDDAIIQLQEQEKDMSIFSLEATSKEQENLEQWELVIDTYQKLLEIDTDLQFAKTGLIRSKQRQQIHAQIQSYIDDYDILNDPLIMQRATNLLLKAIKIEGGPRLKSQISELNRLLKRANTPIKITLLSDNLTRVRVFRVSELEIFNVKQMTLRPGNYTVVGIREGYRDVRVEFRVAPEIRTTPIIIICEEKI
jgi:serine/threonine protein kinase